MKIYKLGRKKAHRDQLIANLTASLLVYERIVTTLPKARLAARNTEHIITRILKLDDSNGYKYALETLGNKKKVAKKLVEVIKKQYQKCNGGYTRMIKIGNRKGDNAKIVILELTRKMDTALSLEKQKSSNPEKKNDKATAKTKSEGTK